MTAFSNLRRNPFTSAYSWRTMDTEYHTVAEYAELPGIYGIQLQDRPRSGSVVVTEDETAGDVFVQVSTSPLQGQCRIDYNSGYIFFNSADSGAAVAVDYEGGGSTANKANLEALVNNEARLTALEAGVEDLEDIVFGGETGTPSRTIPEINDWIDAHDYAVGDTFTQFPIAASNDIATAFPVAQRPATRFGGTWTQIWETEAIVFQTQEADETGMQTRTNGSSADQMQGHWHTMYNDTAGVGGSTNRPPQNVAADDNPVSAAPFIKAKQAETDGVNGTPRTGIRTAHKNRLFLLWKRTA